jgi:hypothetical protein
MSSPA